MNGLIKEQVLNDDGLNTLLTEIEAILNSQECQRTQMIWIVSRRTTYWLRSPLRHFRQESSPKRTVMLAGAGDKSII